MTGISEFEIELLKEKNNTISNLNRLKDTILQITYIDKKKVLEYYNTIDMIIYSIDKEYESVRKWGQSTNIV